MKKKVNVEPPTVEPPTVGPPTVGPPTWARQLLRRITAPHLREEIQGDMDELFYKRGQQHGYFKARFMYVLDLLLLLHPRLWRRKPVSNSESHYTRHHEFPKPEYRTTSILNPDMIRNYLTIAFRNLLKNKAYSAINIFGLAVGFACCIAIGLYVQDEVGYDKFHQNGGDIYRVVEEQNMSGVLYDIATSPGPLAPALKADFGEILQTCRIRRIGSRMFKIQSRVVESGR